MKMIRKRSYLRLIQRLWSHAKVRMGTVPRPEATGETLQEFHNTETSGFRKLDRLTRWKEVQRLAHSH